LEALHHEQLVPAVVDDLHRHLPVLARLEGGASCSRQVLVAS
jgi:hypothetical protein